MSRLLAVDITDGVNTSIFEGDTSALIFDDGDGIPDFPNDNTPPGFFDFVVEIVANSLKPKKNTIVIPCKDLPKQDGILFDRSDPAFVVFISGKKLKRTNISSLITRVTFTESDDQNNTCEIEFENAPLSAIDDPMFNARNEVELYMGYINTGLDFIGTFVIDKPKFSIGENVNITMNGKLINIRMTEHERQEVHRGISDVELVDKIAKRNGFFAAINDSDVKNQFLSKKHDSIAQAGITDWDLLRQRAFQNGFILDTINYVIDGLRRPVIYFGRPRNCDSGVVLSYKDSNPLFANLDSFEPTENTYKRNCGVKYGAHNPTRLGKHFREIFLGGPKYFKTDELDAAIQASDLQDYYSQLDQEIFQDTQVPAQFICESDPDSPGDNGGKHGGPFNYQRSFNDIIDSSDIDNNLVKSQQNELSARVLNGEDPEIVSNEIVDRDTRLGVGFGNLTENFINFIPRQDKGCRQTVLSDLGEEHSPEETCRISNNVQESIRYVVEASCQPSIGNTKLRKGYLVTIKGVGKFSGKYIIKSVTHTIDSSGYKISSMNVKSKGTKKNSSPKFSLSDDRNPLPIDFLKDSLISSRRIIQDKVEI